MTVSTTNARYSYAANGSQTAFSFPRFAQAAADFVVTVATSAGVETVKTLTTDYTVTGSGTSWTITFSTAPASGSTVVIFRDPSLVQETDFEGEGDPLGAINTAIDRIYSALQALKDESVTKSLGSPSGFSTALPSPTGKAGYALVVSSDELGYDYAAEIEGAAVSSAMTPVLEASSLALGQVAFGIHERLTAPRTYYVDHALGSNSNTGLSAGSGNAFATITYAYKYIRDRIDCNGQKVVIQVADGTWSEYVVCHGPVTGLQAAVSGTGISPETSAGVIIRGNLSSKAAGHNSRSDTNPCFSFAHGARVRVEGIKFSNPSATDTLFKVYANARVEVGQVVAGAGPASAAHFQAADGGTIVGVASSDSLGWVEWSGGAGIGVVCEVGTGTANLSDVRFDGAITFTGHPASAFVNCGEGAYFSTNITWTGTFTGRKYWVSENAVLSDAGTTDIESIPGSLPGVRTSSTVTAPGTRLTLTSGLPVTTGDVTAATSVFLAPSSDKYVLVRNGVSSGLIRQTIPAAGISLRLNATDHLANNNYDLFTYSISDGTAVLATGPAWTNATTRSGAISQVDGTWVNTSTMTLRYDNAGAGSTTSVSAAAGTAAYVGTFRTTGSNGQTEDSIAKRFLWNNYNRRLRPMRVLEGTDTWTYSTAAWRQVNGSTANQLDFVVGISEDAVVARAIAEVSSDTATVRALRTGIALDSTAGITTGCLSATQPVTNAGFEGLTALYSGLPGIGRHFLAWLEWGGGADTQTWRGDAGVADRVQSGITGELWA